MHFELLLEWVRENGAQAEAGAGGDCHRPAMPGAHPTLPGHPVLPVPGPLMLGLTPITRKTAALFNMVHPEDHYDLQTQAEGKAIVTGGSRDFRII